MYKLVSDPLRAPIHEVVFEDDAGAPCVSASIGGGWNQDTRFGGKDGQTLLLNKPRFDNLTLIVSKLYGPHYHDLLRMEAAGLPIYVFPNFDRHTLLWAPLTGSTAMLRADKANGVLVEAATIHTRNSAAYAPDINGNFQQSAVNVARFGASAVGPGMYFAGAYDNRATHPISGALQWAAVAGSPTISWTGAHISPLLSKAGCVVIAKSTGTPITARQALATGDSGTGGEYVYASVYLRGRGRVTISLTIGATSTTRADIDLTDDDWVEYHLPPLAKTDAATTWNMDIDSANDTAFDTIFYVGPSMVYKGDTTVAPPMFYNDAAVTAAKDLLLDPTVAPQTNDMTMTVCGIVPPAGTTCYFWNASAANLFGFNAGGIVGRLGNVSTTVNIPQWAAWEGRPFWAAMRCRLQDISGKTAAQFADHGIRVWMSVGNEILTAINGVEPAVSTIGGTMTLGEDCGPLGLQHFRMDGRAWTDAQVEAHRTLFRWWDGIVIATQGYQFTISDDTLSPLVGVPEHYAGEIKLEAIARDPDMAVY